MNIHWLLRMSRWARRPPSKERVALVLAVVAFCLLLFGFETVFGWPESLTPEKIGSRPVLGR